MQFKWAVCQHPMTLIIKEDETSLERVPPYGAESFHAYYLKIKENLDYLKEHDFAKICFETSIPETMFILESYPEIRKEFNHLARNGKLSFVGGTYGQVHTHTLTSESNFRQLEVGLKKYKELFGINISLYAVQEPGHHEQMPQLLRASGFEFATLPTFTYSLIFLEQYELVSFMEMAWMRFTKERGMEQDQITRICFTKDNEFAWWTGLDGSEIPLYLIDPMRWCRKEDIRNEYKKDLYSSPSVRLYLTDLLDFNPEIVRETLEHAQFELADRAIAERFKACANFPKPRARVYSYYSYLEGSKGDIAYIKNRYLESLVLSAQSLEAYLILNKWPHVPDIERDTAWKVLLETQHHDICYPDAPLLQEWAVKKIDGSIQYLNPVIDKLKSLLVKYILKSRGVSRKEQPEKEKRCKEKISWGTGNSTQEGCIINFNCVPHEITCAVKLKVPEKQSPEEPSIKGNNIVLVDAKGRNIGCQACYEGDSKYLVFVDTVDGFGAKILKFSDSPKEYFKVKKSIKGLIENEFYRCEVNENCEIKNLLIKKHNKIKGGGKNKSGKYILFEDWANRLSAAFNDETPVKFESKPKKFIQESGSVYDFVSTEGAFSRSGYKKEAKFYREIPRIDFKVTFDFNDQQIGNFFLEETKLCIVWPVKDLRKIRHDIPFGVVQGRKSRPLYAINWINCGMENNVCFSVLPRGKIKFFERDGLLYNLLAWGDEGVDFMRVGGTCAPEILKGNFDLKLKGHYSFEYSFYLHAGIPENQELFRVASGYNNPFLSVYSNRAPLPDEDIIFKLENENVWTTSVFSENKKVKCRFFECNGKRKKIKLTKKRGISISEIKDIYGKKMKMLSPFRISEMSISDC